MMQNNILVLKIIIILLAKKSINYNKVAKLKKFNFIYDFVYKKTIILYIFT